MKNLFILITLWVILFSSCESLFNGQIVDIKIPEHTPSLAPYAFFTDGDSTLYVQVGKSAGILDSTDLFVMEDATVQLFKDGSFFNQFSFDPISRIYKLETPSGFGLNETGTTYELRVTVDGFETATASQIMPAAVPIDTAVYIQGGSTDGFGNPMDIVNITFKDPAGVENYYEISINYYTSYRFDFDTTQIYEFDYDLGISSIDPILEDGGIFSDKAIDGRLYTLPVGTDAFFGEGLNVIESRLTVNLYSITKEYYNFKKSLTTYQNVQGNPFAEPVILFSNFSSNLGTFGLRKKSTIVVLD